MRRLGQVLQVEAMSLYKHVANKDDILDGIADLVTGHFEVPDGDVAGRRPSDGVPSRPTRSSCATPGPAAWSSRASPPVPRGCATLTP